MPEQLCFTRLLCLGLCGSRSRCFPSLPRHSAEGKLPAATSDPHCEDHCESVLPMQLLPLFVSSLLFGKKTLSHLSANRNTGFPSVQIFRLYSLINVMHSNDLGFIRRLFLRATSTSLFHRLYTNGFSRVITTVQAIETGTSSFRMYPGFGLQVDDGGTSKVLNNHSKVRCTNGEAFPPSPSGRDILDGVEN